MSELENILKEAYSEKASDVHFRSNEKIWFRINGVLAPFHPKIFKNEELLQMFQEIIPPVKLSAFSGGSEIDFAWEIKDVVRFRISIYRDIEGVAACFRLLPSEIKTVNDLKIEPCLLELCSRKKGLILVTGPTGSGKSTTMASLIDYINIIEHGHIITIEDPIEFIFKERNSLVNQREINTNTMNFSDALRASFREDPDVVMVGEMRDLETTATALEVAETGHLVLSTLHTNSAATTIYRIINQFPKKKQDQIRISLASSLIGVISQTLIPLAAGGGRIAVKEIMVVNHAIANLIRENKIYQINNIIQMNKNAGMITMSDAMIELIEQGVITPIDALMKAPDPKQLEKTLSERGIF